MADLLVPKHPALPELPPILAGQATPEVKGRVEQFVFSIPEIFEAWVARRSSAHTQRAYREDVMAFVRFLGLRWPQDAARILSVTVRETRVPPILSGAPGGTQDYQPAHFVSFQLLQVFGGRGGGASSANYDFQSGARTVHLSGIE